MNWLTGVWLRGLVWMVAVMLPVQPLAASRCSCCHSTDAPEIVGKNSEAVHGGCSTGRCGCGSKHNRTEASQQAKVPFAPCECPASCPCHLQHAPKLAVKSQEVQVEKCDAVTLYVAPLQRPAVTHEIELAQISIEYAVIWSESALELCAALCRFTI